MMLTVKTTLGVIIAITLVTTIVYTVVLVILPQLAEAAINRVGGDIIASRTKGPGAAPIATSGNNIYITWSTNTTGNDEVMFKASADVGKTFGNKMNLSNSPKSDSQDAQIAASGSNVYVSWWERANQTSNEPVMKISTDNGKSFGEVIKLSSNTTSG